jgi:CMP-N,N'-diacetyllegionaminic acid synthase
LSPEGSVIGLIPARGGSKGIPGKNVVPIAGKPLLAWTVEAGLAAKSLDHVVVSTDADEIAAAARTHGAAVIARPHELAADDTPMLPVILDALDRLEGCETIVLLQPTSPLRRAEQIDEAVALLRSSGADGVVSTVDVPHRYLPASLMRVDGDRLTPVDPQSPLLRQQKGFLVARNGPAILALDVRALRERGDLYGGDLRAYAMDEISSIDVDTPADLRIAEALLRARG